jgi:hypothetical protein
MARRRFLALVGAPHCSAGTLDRGELGGLAVGGVLGPFEQRPAGVLEPAGVVGAGAFPQLVPVGAAHHV